MSIEAQINALLDTEERHTDDMLVAQKLSGSARTPLSVQDEFDVCSVLPGASEGWV